VQNGSSIGLSKKKLDFYPEYMTDVVTVTANGPWRVVKHPQWISTSASGNSLFVTAITQGEYTGAVVIGCGDETDSIHVSMTGTQLSVSTTSVTFEPQVWLAKVVEVTSNVSWDVSVGVYDEWLSVDTTNSYRSNSFIITAEPYEGKEPRRGQVYVKGGPSPGKLIVIGVLQNAPDIKVDPALIYFESNASLSHPVVVTSNVIGWTAEINRDECDWLSFNSDNSYYVYGDGAGSFTVTATPNTTNTMRTYDIVISRDDESLLLKVMQAPPISASPGALYFEADKSLTQPVFVTTKGNWSITSNAGWISFSTTAGNGNGSFEVTATSNTGGMRTGEITISGGGAQTIIPVSQNAYVAPRTTLSPEYLSFEPYASEKAIKITSNVSWKASSNVPWLTVDRTEGFGDATIVATAKSNTGYSRSGIITVEAERSFTIMVEQKATQDMHFVFEGIHYYAPNRNASDVEVESFGAEGYSGNIVIPATVSYSSKTYRVTKIGDRAFYKCTELTSITMPTSIVDVGDRAFAYCDKLVSVNIPNSVMRIGEWAFCACTNLTSVDIPNSVKKIMNGAFYKCDKLKSVVIPVSVSEIGCMAFYACDNLNEMHVYWPTAPRLPYINPDFSDYEHCTLYVPAGTKLNYRLNWYWSSFVDIVERGVTDVSDAASEGVSVVIENGRLYVDSPSAEAIHIYSFTGKLLYTSRKEAGRAEFDVPSTKLFIVRGSNGWTRKLLGL
jgi:hypothetical protein